MKKKIGIFQLFLLGVLSAFSPLAMDLYLPGLPALQQDLHTSTSLAQLTITASLLGLALGQVIIGPLSDRIGRRTPLLWGTILFGLSSATIVFAPNIWVLIILRLIQGLAGSTGIVLSLAVITDLFTGKTLTKQNAINQTINGVFPVLAPVFGGVIIAIADWQMTFWVLAVLGLILFVSVLLALPETLPAEKTQVTDRPSVVGGFAQLFKQREFVLYALTQAFMTAALFAYISGSSFVLQKIFGMSVTTFGIVYAINGAGIALMSSLAGRWAVKFGEYRALRWFIRAGFLGGILLLITAFLPKSLWLILPPLFLVVATVGGIISLTTALGMQGQQQNAGSASALLGLARYALGGLMSPIVGLFGQHTYMPMAILIVAVQLVGFFIFSQVKKQ
ncbi:multidrug effflux MFS transporter [Weissella cibaria]|uniref:multidrug effflux MFS transporter n=1 Tax=Weissella cibaria TaxID=137591 RepID=UPI000705B6F0|nr:multidrug effflux MFS transporter [Weissella cibaria]ALI33284.1 MFS transporter [Weissella cibaria]WCE24059.1 multidrug effflux MFS transporter [Weissella cibaria]WCE26247.1 multidrug effflux MFS transporter [Weissella cibaria]HCU10488.1 MFS transporter [Weissella cibaria]